MDLDAAVLSLFPLDQQQELEREHMPYMCRYTSKRCFNDRALKRNGTLHNLCDFHRSKANNNQRRFELRRRVNAIHYAAGCPSYLLARRAHNSIKLAGFAYANGIDASSGEMMLLLDHAGGLSHLRGLGLMPMPVLDIPAACSAPRHDDDDSSSSISSSNDSDAESQVPMPFAPIDSIAADEIANCNAAMHSLPSWRVLESQWSANANTDEALGALAVTL